MVRRPSIDEIRERTYKTRDSWWTVLFVDPFAARVVRFLSPYGWATPNRITGASFLLGLVSAAFFSQATRGWLVAGAVMFYLSFVLDCVDGKIARLNSNGSIFGTWLDYVLDRLRVLACSVGLFGGQFAMTRNPAFLVAGALVVFLDMFRYLNAQLVSKTRAAMRQRLAERRSVLYPAADALADDATPDADAFGPPLADEPGSRSPAVSGVAVAPSWYLRLRDHMLRRRIRMHIFSGIEFHVAVFIAAPLSGFILTFAFVACGFLLIFETAVIYRLWAVARSTEHEVKELDRLVAQLHGGELRPPSTNPGTQSISDELAGTSSGRLNYTAPDSPQDD